MPLGGPLQVIGKIKSAWLLYVSLSPEPSKLTSPLPARRLAASRYLTQGRRFYQIDAISLLPACRVLRLASVSAHKGQSSDGSRLLRNWKT